MVLLLVAAIAAVVPPKPQPGQRENDILWRFESSRYPIMVKPGDAPGTQRS